MFMGGAFSGIRWSKHGLFRVLNLNRNLNLELASLIHPIIMRTGRRITIKIKIMIKNGRVERGAATKKAEVQSAH